MTHLYDLAVIGSIAYTLFRIVCGAIEFSETWRRAPWPQARTTPEPCRLTLVRSVRVFDWEKDGVA